jgi:hypothetical protein
MKWRLKESYKELVKQKIGSLKKKKKMNIHTATLNKRKREKTQINTIRLEKATLQQMSIKFRAPLGNILKTHTLTNWKKIERMD